MEGQDPITRLRTRLTADGTATAAELGAIDAEVQALVEAETFACNSPWPTAPPPPIVYAAPVASPNRAAGSNQLVNGNGPTVSTSGTSEFPPWYLRQ
ncbi:MAG: hypothetical protein H6644_06075 [Caldilineaceae bacterium]|nr:hypothetical protein [Caldilineaceae bacterium]